MSLDFWSDVCAMRWCPVDKRVDVYYNRERLETAVLEPSITWSSYIGIGDRFFVHLNLFDYTYSQHRAILAT